MFGRTFFNKKEDKKEEQKNKGVTEGEDKPDVNYREPLEDLIFKQICPY